MDENQLANAVEAYNSQNATKSLRKVAKDFGVPYTTLHRRVNGGRSKTEAYEDKRALSNYQEQLLESHLIFLAQKKTPLSRMETRKLAGKLKYGVFSLDNSKPLSDNWLLGFLSRSKYLKLKKGKHLDMPRIRENGAELISLFFDLYTYYINAFNIHPDCIWNLDEAGFRIGESTDRLDLVVPDNAPHTVSHDSSELVTALEMISRTGKVGKPLFIYKGVHQMVGWFPGTIREEYNSATSPTGFINESIFHEWVSEHFPSSEDKWSLLLLDGHLTHTSDRVMATLMSKKVIPLYFPSHMTNIIQPLDRSCFGHAKILFRRHISHNFVTGLNPKKAHFLEAYMRVRKQAYSPKTIIGGWRRCGLLEKSPNVALIEYRRQMHHRIVTPHDSAQEESVIETGINENFTPKTQTKRLMRKEDPKITREQFLLKSISDLKKKNRKLQYDNRQLQRIASNATTSKQIIEIQAIRVRNELEEEKKKHSRKRTRIPQPNKRLILSHPDLILEEHPLANHTSLVPTLDSTIDPS